jgi:two-component system response regulator MprA
VSGDTPRILVVEDEAGIRETIVEILMEEGYSVTVAADGVEALTAVAAAAPDAILLDLMLPRLDGFGVAAELQQRGLRPGIPIVVATADGHAREKATRIGAEAWLAKPFTIDALLAAVAQALTTG